MPKSSIILIILSLCVGTGALFFFIWAVKKGFFDDVEGPKYRMLDDDETYLQKKEDSPQKNRDDAP